MFDVNTSYRRGIADLRLNLSIIRSRIVSNFSCSEVVNHKIKRFIV